MAKHRDADEQQDGRKFHVADRSNSPPVRSVIAQRPATKGSEVERRLAPRGHGAMTCPITSPMSSW